MTSDSSKRNKDPFFVKPDPSFLQSEENRADMQEKYEDADPNGPFFVADEVPTDSDVLPGMTGESDEAPTVAGSDPDAIARSGDGTTLSPEAQDSDRQRDRQIGTTFRSGS